MQVHQLGYIINGYVINGFGHKSPLIFNFAKNCTLSDHVYQMSIILNLKWQGVKGRTISTGVKHMKTFYIFALTRICFKDFPFLKAIIGGSLKISPNSGWFFVLYHFSIKTRLIFDTERSYFVTKGKMSLLFLF